MGIGVPSLLLYHTWVMVLVAIGIVSNSGRAPGERAYLTCFEILSIQTVELSISKDAPFLFVRFTKVIASQNSGGGKSSQRNEEKMLFFRER